VRWWASLRQPFDGAQDKHWAKRGFVVSSAERRGRPPCSSLSRITEPTEGRADIDGRVGSLLEAMS
jgi:hypothetical protein